MSKKIITDIMGPRPTAASYTFSREIQKRVTPPERPQHNGSLLRILSVLFFTILFIVLAVVVGNQVSRATITITPQSRPVNFDTELFTAQRSVNAELDFEIVSIEGQESATIRLTETSTATRNATGALTLTNTGTTRVRIPSNTSVTHQDGLVFKIEKETFIGANSTSTVPIVAQEPGFEYNIETGSFSLPATFTTLSITSVQMPKGGARGAVYTQSKEDVKTLYRTLDEQLRVKLMSQIVTQLPEGYHFFPGMTVFIAPITTEVIESQFADTTITHTGRLTAYIFKKETLEKALLTRARISDTTPITIASLDAFSLDLLSRPVRPAEVTQIEFYVSGAGTAVWEIDTVAITEALLGQKKKDLGELLVIQSPVYQAQARMLPFWQRTFPKNKDRITTIIVDSK